MEHIQIYVLIKLIGMELKSKKINIYPKYVRSSLHLYEVIDIYFGLFVIQLCSGEHFGALAMSESGTKYVIY